MNLKIKQFLSKVAEIKNDIKDEISYRSPLLGKTLDHTEKIIKTVQNGHRSIPLSLKPMIMTTTRQFPVFEDPESTTDKPISDLYTIDEGAHIMVKRFGYEHHGLSLGDGLVIHYSEGTIRTSPIQDFCGRNTPYIVESTCIYDTEHIISRAYSRIFEKEYNLLVNNCEHFVLWCRSGSKIHHHI